MRISDWSSDVCSSDHRGSWRREAGNLCLSEDDRRLDGGARNSLCDGALHTAPFQALAALFRSAVQRSDERSEEHTSELQSLMRISYAVFCLKKKRTQLQQRKTTSEYLARGT